MNTIPAQEIKRRGIAAVDDLLAKGDIHVIRNNQPHLRYHKQTKRCASTSSYRLSLTLLLSDQEIILLDVGSHDEDIDKWY
ncbi:MAG: hypothetical protein PSV18_07915 [Methylobacter sp.]|uniref:Uncharacterized protein n=1 Tax=Candidatus Methylobacter titanis TaxID=3053457 RepID=A0AA43Q8H4_9GAMM|nr:hypothetical protein [Candidatus Methylobacter titanis]MDI1292657.1 hypothetical protein [Candidatus Methylobacter titanis]